MKEKNVLHKEVLRYLLSQIKNKQIETRQEPSDDDIFVLIKKDIKSRQEAIEFLVKAGKDEDIVEQQASIAFLQQYLPRLLSKEELTALLYEVIQTHAITDIAKQRGEIVKYIMASHKSVIDGALLQDVIHETIAHSSSTPNTVSPSTRILAFLLILGGCVLSLISSIGFAASGLTPEQVCESYKSLAESYCDDGVCDASYTTAELTAWDTYDACTKCTSATDQASCKDGTNMLSCDTLFTDAAKARVCNWSRCIIEKGLTTNQGDDIKDNACNCKYGVGGVGERGIPLNTSLPFVGNCIEKSNGDVNDTTSLGAFPQLMGVISKMLVTVILLVSFIMIIVGGVQWASGDAKSGKAQIQRVAIGIALLGLMGAILRLINPNFFK